MKDMGTPKIIAISNRKTCLPVHINVQLPQEDIKYLGLHLDNGTYLAQTHFSKTETSRNHPHQNVLVTQMQVKTLHKQQTSHI
jgi:hypothetical protein